MADFNASASTMPKRAIRIANCSGATTDSAIHMFNQAKYGPVDVITGDYLAEQNMAAQAEAMRTSSSPGWISSAFEGIKLSLDIVHEKRIKIIVNGGGLNPKGLAETIQKLADEKHLRLRVAYVDGDNLMSKVHALLTQPEGQRLQHLDHENPSINLADPTLDFLRDPERMPIVSANAYLGYRAIKKGLDCGADIIICGRVADASPVIGAAAWWYGWHDTDFDRLAGALIAGHLIECSTYITGGNFAGAHDHPVGDFINMGLPVVEIAADGECVVTKHEALNGFVTPDTVKCQLLYELQGNIYLNSDVKADIALVEIASVGPNRVKVSGVRGQPPPPTTKLAIFYRGGYQCEILVNACGYATEHKWDVQEAQVRSKLEEWGVANQLDVLDFQRVGKSMANPASQLESTTYMRIVAQAKDAQLLSKVPSAWFFYFMAHFPGMHCSLDFRTLRPKPFLGYYPALVQQHEISEGVSVSTNKRSHTTQWERFPVGPPRATESLARRENYETANPAPLSTFGPTTMRPLGDIALARSGDKGANVNLGLFVHSAAQWEWFRSFMTRHRLQQMMGKDWESWYFIERVEFPKIYAVHFVVYGPLGRGVSSCVLLDCLGKGFAEFIRAVHVPVPDQLMMPSPSSRL